MSIFYQNRPDRMQLFLSLNNCCSPHLHRQAEFIYVLSGSLEVMADHRTHRMEPGQCALFFPNQLHSLQTLQESRILLCIFEADVCPRFRNIFQEMRPLHNLFHRDECSCHAVSALEGLLALAPSCPRNGALPSDLSGFCEGYLTLLLTDFFARHTLEPKETSEDLELEQRLLIYLDTHFTEELSLERLSREFGISRFQLSRIFSDRLHTSFPYYINSKRVEYARELLITGNASVTQIALDAGFGSTRTFFREFRQFYHASPGEYRSSKSSKFSRKKY